MGKDTKIKLKPCPFCGGTKVHIGTSTSAIDPLPNEASIKYFICCAGCHAYGPKNTDGYVAEVLWNTRNKKRIIKRKT